MQGIQDRERALEEAQAAKLQRAGKEPAAKSPLAALSKRLRTAQRAQQDTLVEYLAAEKGAGGIVKAMEK